MANKPGDRDKFYTFVEETYREAQAKVDAALSRMSAGCAHRNAPPDPFLKEKMQSIVLVFVFVFVVVELHSEKNIPTSGVFTSQAIGELST